MKIHDLRPSEGSKKNKKRVGRGPGSGHGKTSCKGHKGQKARSGKGKGPGFEGGQMPLQRRLPKRGFKNYPFSKDYTIINLEDINRFEDVKEISPEFLIKEKIVKKLRSGIKILARGDIKRPVTVKANAFSKSAVQKITAAGGKAEVI